MKFTRESIEDIINDILIHDGPDGHCDGSEIITDFIIALKRGTGEKWVNKYRKTRLIRK